MRSAQVYRWQIPMDVGVALRDRRLKTHDELYVCLREGERKEWGEISPLPGFSQESWEDAQSVLLAWVNNWLAGDCELLQTPSVAFGVSCALAELADTLSRVANYRAAPLCSGDPNDLILKLVDMPGEKVAEVKVGLYEAVRDGMVVNLLLEAIPDLYLRLGANRVWIPLKSQQFAKYVNPDYRHRIVFLEESCKTHDDSRAFARETGVAITWDESLREPDFTFVAEEGVCAAVIKSTFTGSLDKIREQVQAARALGLAAVISSSIESNSDLTQLARIAAWLTPDTIPGLDTLDLIQTQQVRRWPGGPLLLVDVNTLGRLLQSSLTSRGVTGGKYGEKPSPYVSITGNPTGTSFVLALMNQPPVLWCRVWLRVAA